MSGMDSTAVAQLVRANLWSDQLKEILKDVLLGQKFVNWMSNFPDGSTFNIPSIGEIPMREAAEGSPVVYDQIDTGNFQFVIDRYVEAATYITDVAKQDAYYADQLIASFIPKMRRALEENLETSIFALANTQTLASPNGINNAAHRWVAGEGGTDRVISLQDFAAAKFALDKAHTSGTRVAIIDPAQEYILNTLTNIVNVSNNPRFEGIVNGGFVNGTTGMSFVKNIYGFDVYVSNFLPTVGAETISTAGTTVAPNTGAASVAGDKANLFMSLGGQDETPFKGAWRQAINVEYERNKDLRRDEYVMNGRFGLKLYRPESLVTVLGKSTL